jgi:27-O-demethylrifamycin SV methyltransferase
MSDYDAAAHYDRVTHAWQLLLGDELHYGVFGGGHEPLDVATRALTQWMVDAARLAPGLRVLDVGCGTGTPACELARVHDVSVLGITTSAVGVALANDRAAGLGLSGVSFEERDGTANGLPDASFDRVWVLESAHLMRERDQLLAECARVLRPGGRVVLCDLIGRRTIPFSEVKRRREEFATLRTAFGDAHFQTLDFYRTGFEGLGLAVDQVDDLTAATRPTFDRWRHNAEVHRAAVLDAIDEADLTAFVRSCDILEACWDDGTFGYGLVAAQKPASGSS